MEKRKALAVHHTPTSDKAWDGPKAEKNLKSDADASYYKKAYAWVDPDGDPETKSAYKFIHHEVDSEGNIGAANIRACQAGIGVLNGARGGAKIPAADKKGVYNHLAVHIKDADLEPPELKSIKSHDDTAVEEDKIERRYFDVKDVELRIEGEDEGEEEKIVGYAAVFNKWGEGYGIKEKISPGAFEKSLESSDVRALFNHNPDMPLGRESAGNLRLREDKKGLYMELKPIDTTYSRDLKEAIRTNVITQMSFAFETEDEEWHIDGKEIPERTLKEVKLFDVSPVTFPFYTDTSVALRSLEKYKEKLSASGDVDNTNNQNAQGRSDEVRRKKLKLHEKILRSIKK